MALTPEDGEAYAGLIAASDVVVSKQLRFREPPPAFPPRAQPPRVGDLPRLFARDDSDSPARRVARLSSAALVYSAKKEDRTQAEKILHGDDEREVLARLHNARAEARAKARDEGFKDDDRCCPHCRLLYRSLYSRKFPLPPIQVVNHSARVNVTFDPDTCVSGASINRFQVIAPRRVAQQLIRLGHPLRWAQAQASLFRRTDPVHPDGRIRDDLGTSPEEIEWNWKHFAKEEGAALVMEDVVWPVNQALRASSVNILRIADFDETGSSLRYDYALERSLRSNFGVAWEHSGLDVDGGTFEADATPLEKIYATSNLEELRLDHLNRRDVVEMKANAQPTDSALFANDFDQMLYRGWSDPDRDDFQPDKVDASEVTDALMMLGERLAIEYPREQFDLLTVSASKELHFTIPENGPIELWYLLTWMAPAILFTFLTHAICQAPHVLLAAPVTSARVGDSHAY
jgi:hypothetical protein